MNRNTRGVTLMELLVTTLVLAVFIAMVGSTMNGVNAMWQVVMGVNPSIAQHRSIADMLSEHLRNAQGCRASGNPYYKLAIVAASANSITYVTDKDTCETVRYYLSGTNLMRQDNGGSAKTVATGVTGLVWSYFKSSTYFAGWSSTTSASSPTGSELFNLSGLKLRLTTSSNGQAVTSKTTVRLRNSPYKTRLDGL